MTTYLQKRLQNLQGTLQKHKIHTLLVTTPSNITYLTGVTPIHDREREAFLLITQDKSTAIVSPLRIDQFDHLKKFQVLGFNQNILTQTINTLPQKLRQAIHIEADNLKVSELQRLKSQTKSTFKPAPQIIEDLRIIKDQYEVDQIIKACKITSKTWQQIQPQIKPGVTEQQLAHQITATQIDLGADGIPEGFHPIVAFGKNSAVPHHTSSKTKLKLNDTALFDFGCSVNGYSSDFTRTIFIGKASAFQTQIESIVKTAFQKAVDGLKPDVSAAHIDRLAREYINSCDYGHKFIHTTGHGLGLDIHEPPSIYHNTPNPTPLQTNMAITIEPGIYLKGKFGYRHEDTLLITTNGSANLTNSNT